MPRRKLRPVDPALLTLFDALVSDDQATDVDPAYLADLEARLLAEHHPAGKGGRPHLTVLPGGKA